MELMTTGARQIGMMSRRQVRRGPLVAAGWGLAGVLLAGCGSVVASTGAPAPGASTPAGGAATASTSAPALPPIGCASVNRATMVTVSRITHLAPLPNTSLMITDSNPAQVRALFRDFCAAVTHPYFQNAVIHCPADFGTDYAGVFYGGNRALAKFTYAASGCRRVSVIVGSTTRSTMVAGQAAAAAPHMAADFAAILNAPKSAAGQ
jgi:hypothetical protein